MREIILLVASLAGAAILTALAVLISPHSPMWRWVLWAGIAILTACAFVLLIDLIWHGRRAIWLVGMGIGVALFIGCGIAFYFGPPAMVDAQPSPQEAARRTALLESLRHEYILSHDGLSPALIAGTEPPPADWINQRLIELGESWRVSLPVPAPPTPPLTLSRPIVTDVPPAPRVTEYLRDMQVSGPYEGSNVINLIGRPNVTIDRLRVFMDYSGDSTSASGKQRFSVGELNDVVRDVFINYPILHKNTNPTSSGKYFWGATTDHPLSAGISHVRVVIIAPDGTEQYYSFVIYLGDPRIEITPDNRVNNPGFIIKNEDSNWRW